MLVRRCQKDLRERTILDTFLLMMNHSLIIINQKQENNRKYECLKMIHKFDEAKVPGKRMVTIFVVKSGLIKPILLVSISVHWYVNSCLSQIFDVISQRREKTGLCGLIFHGNNARSRRT